MPLPSFKFVPKDLLEWSRWLRSVEVAPDPSTVTDESFVERVGLSVLGRSANTDGTPSDITASSNDTILRRVSDALGFGQLTLGMFPLNLVAFTRVQQIATNTLLGRSTAGTGDIEEIVCTAAGRALLDDASASDQRTTLGLGTVATLNTGTSGATVPLLNAANTHASAQCTLFAVGSASPAGTQAANPDTSGATLATLEAEVNQLKAVLRTFGLIAT